MDITSIRGLSSSQAREKLSLALRNLKLMNAKRPAVTTLLGRFWTVDLLAALYGTFLIAAFSYVHEDVNRTIAGVAIIAIFLRHIVSCVPSRIQSLALSKQLDKLQTLVEGLQDGENLKDVDYRVRNDTLVEVFRDTRWVRLPSVVLVEDDIVRLKPGERLPCCAKGIKGKSEDVLLQPNTAFEDAEPGAQSYMHRKAYHYFRILDTPIEQLLARYIDQMDNKRNVNCTFFQVTSRTVQTILKVFIAVLVTVYTAGCIGWCFGKEQDALELVACPNIVMLAEVVAVLPALFEVTMCWGNAYVYSMICVMHQTERPPTVKRSSSMKPQQPPVSYLEVANPEHKAEAEYEDLELRELIPKVHFCRKFTTFLHFLSVDYTRTPHLIDTFNSITVLSFMDRDGILSENSKYIEEVMIIGENDEHVILDLVHKSPNDILMAGTGHDELAFQDQRFSNHLNALKPLSLALSLCRTPRKSDTIETLLYLTMEEDGQQKETHTGDMFYGLDLEETELFRYCLCSLSRHLGFTEEAVKQHKHELTVWTTWRPENPDTLHNMSYSQLSTHIEGRRTQRAEKLLIKDAAENIALKLSRSHAIRQRMAGPSHLLTSIIEKEGHCQVVSLGNPGVILQNCVDYWDGESLVRLSDEDRQRINTMLLQWTADDLSCIGLSYQPLLSDDLKQELRNRENFKHLDEEIRDKLFRLQKDQIFLGMIALKTHARKEANRFIEDAFSSGIRFVLFNEESLLHTKIIGDELGLDIDWNSCISLSKNSDFCAFINSMGMRVLPAGIDEIKKHLTEKVDNVPLLVSMFSDSSPESVLEMVKLYQQHGEVVAVVGGMLNCRNIAAYQAADVSIGLGVQPCGFCTACSGQRINFHYLMSRSEEITQTVIATPCSFTLGPNASLYRIMQVIKEARKFMRNIQLSVLFALSCYVMITVDAVVAFTLGWPPPLSIGQYSFVIYLVVPVLAVSFLSKRSTSELMKVLPIKMMHFSLKESQWFIRNHSLRILLGTFGFLLCQSLNIGLYLDSSSLSFAFEWQESLKCGELKAMQLIQLFWICVWVLWVAPGYLAGSDDLHFSLCRNLKWDVATTLIVLSTMLTIIGYLGTCDCSEDMITVLTAVWPEAIVFVGWLAGYQAFDRFLKREERRQYQRIQKTMGLFFHTKLGMHSPK